MSSSRGPGLIGTLLAIMIVGGFGTLSLLVFDERFMGGEKTIEAVIRDQDSRILASRGRLENLRQRMKKFEVLKRQATEVLELSSRSKFARQKIAALGVSRDAAKSAEAEATASWEAYKDAYRESEWASAKGEELDRLLTVSGKEFKRVVIKAVSHKGIDISHEGGLRLVPAEELPPELRDRFQLDREKTAADAAATAAAVDLHFDHVEIARLATEANDKLLRIRELETTVANTRDRLMQAEVGLPTQEEGIVRMQKAIENERTRGLSRAPAMGVKLRQMQNKLEATRRSIPAMNAELRAMDQEIRTLSGEVAALEAEIATIKETLGAKDGGQPQR